MAANVVCAAITLSGSSFNVGPSGVQIGDSSLSYILGPGVQGQDHSLLALVGG
jgi:hypothetical protein